MATFPIEHARSRWTIRIALASLCCVVGHGRAVAFEAHLAVLLVLQCCVGLRCTVLHQTYSALLVDVFQEEVRHGCGGEQHRQMYALRVHGGSAVASCRSDWV